MSHTAEELRQEATVAYSHVAALAFLAWEYCITFPDEFMLIWSLPHKRPIKWAFLILRYYTFWSILLTQRTHRETGICVTMGICVALHCEVWYALQIVSLQIVVGLQQILMATRIYALFEASHRMLIFLSAMFVIQHIIMIVFAIRTYPTVNYNDICIATSVSDHVNAVGIGFPPILFDTLLLALTVYKVVRSAPRTWRHIPLLWTLLRDGTWAFLVLLVSGLDGVFFLVFEGPVASVGWSWQLAASSFTACRVILNMFQQKPNTGSNGQSMSTGRKSCHATQTAHGMRIGEAWALTTFDPGNEFAEQDPPDRYGVAKAPAFTFQDNRDRGCTIAQGDAAPSPRDGDDVMTPAKVSDSVASTQLFTR